MIIIANVSDTGVQNTPSHEVLTPLARVYEVVAVAYLAALSDKAFAPAFAGALEGAAAALDIPFETAQGQFIAYMQQRDAIKRLERASLFGGAL